MLPHTADEIAKATLALRVRRENCEPVGEPSPTLFPAQQYINLSNHSDALRRFSITPISLDLPEFWPIENAIRPDLQKFAQGRLQLFCGDAIHLPQLRRIGLSAILGLKFSTCDPLPESLGNPTKCHPTRRLGAIGERRRSIGLSCTIILRNDSTCSWSIKENGKACGYHKLYHVARSQSWNLEPRSEHGKIYR